MSRLRKVVPWVRREVRWLYPRPVTTLAVLTVGLLGTLLARAVLPSSWTPPGLLWLVPAALVAYVAMVLGAYTGWSKAFKHTVLDWFDGYVDDAQTWMLAALAGGGFLVVVQLVRSALST